MIYTHLHVKETPAISWDVAHLYEHLFLRTFLAMLKRKGIDPSMMGFIHAETFEGVIFIDAEFYSKDISDIYESLIVANVVDIDLLDAATAECEAEEKSLFVVDDMDTLKRTINDLATVKWQSADNLEIKKIPPFEQPASSILTLQKSAKQFRSVKVGTYLENPSLEEAVLWLRLSVIVNDLVISSMRDKYDSYHAEALPTIDRDKYLVTATVQRMRKNITLREISTHVKLAIDSFDVDANMKYITDHFTEFSNQPLWKGIAVDHYRYAGYLTNPHTIQGLATEKNIKSLLGKLHVKVRAER